MDINGININGRFYSGPELNQYLNDYASENKRLSDKIESLKSACERYEDENRQLTEKLDDIGEQYNAQVAVIGFLEKDNQRFDDENKELKRLLKQAVEDFKTLVLKSTEVCNMKILCDKCPINCTNDNLGWKKEAEALKLIGETNDEP